MGIILGIIIPLILRKILGVKFSEPYVIDWVTEAQRGEEPESGPHS